MVFAQLFPSSCPWAIRDRWKVNSRHHNSHWKGIKVLGKGWKVSTRIHFFPCQNRKNWAELLGWNTGKMNGVTWCQAIFLQGDKMKWQTKMSRADERGGRLWGKATQGTLGDFAAVASSNRGNNQEHENSVRQNQKQNNTSVMNLMKQKWIKRSSQELILCYSHL